MFKVFSQQLRDTLMTLFVYALQLKILRTWINIDANSFLGKYHEMRMGEVALEIISCTKIQACYLHQNIAPGHFTCYCIVL